MLASIIRTVMGTAVGLFYRLERRGPPVPPGPVLLAANHPNSLLDPLLVFATAGRTPRSLAKAPLFERPVVGRLIRASGGIPVYRREDGPTGMGGNEDMFRASTAALREGAAIQIFPEGRSHSDPQLSSLRTGAARIALAAESESGWALGLGIVPIGLTYERKAFFRGRAVAMYGDPIDVARYRDDYERDAFEAARALTDELDRRLRDLTLNLTRSEDQALIDAAERMWAREKGLGTARERLPLADRLPRLQAFARGLAWIRTHDPARYQRLSDAVRAYAREADVLGVGEGDVPTEYRLAPTLRWAVRVAAPVLLLLPVAAVAAIAWGVPYRLVGWAIDRMRLKPDTTATYKLAGSLIAYPLFLFLWTGLAGWAWGWTAALATLLGLPLVGVLTIRWLDGARDLREDLRLFTRLARRRDRREELAAVRRSLVAEFEALQALQALRDQPAPPAALR